MSLSYASFTEQKHKLFIFIPTACTEIPENVVYCHRYTTEAYYQAAPEAQFWHGASKLQKVNKMLAHRNLFYVH